MQPYSRDWFFRERRRGDSGVVVEIITQNPRQRIMKKRLPTSGEWRSFGFSDNALTGFQSPMLRLNSTGLPAYVHALTA